MKQVYLCYSVVGFPTEYPRKSKRAAATVQSTEACATLGYAIRRAKEGRRDFVYFVASPFGRVYIVQAGKVLTTFQKHTITLFERNAEK